MYNIYECERKIYTFFPGDLPKFENLHERLTSCLNLFAALRGLNRFCYQLGGILAGGKAERIHLTGTFKPCRYVS